MPLTEHKRRQALPGLIGGTSAVPKPVLPATNRAREGAPDVLPVGRILK
jgi:hypothetical protein